MDRACKRGWPTIAGGSTVELVGEASSKLSIALYSCSDSKFGHNCNCRRRTGTMQAALKQQRCGARAAQPARRAIQVRGIRAQLHSTDGAHSVLCHSLRSRSAGVTVSSGTANCRRTPSCRMKQLCLRSALCLSTICRPGRAVSVSRALALSQVPLPCHSLWRFNPSSC